MDCQGKLGYFGTPSKNWPSLSRVCMHSDSSIRHNTTLQGSGSTLKLVCQRGDKNVNGNTYAQWFDSRCEQFPEKKSPWRTSFVPNFIFSLLRLVVNNSFLTKIRHRRAPSKDMQSLSPQPQKSAKGWGRGRCTRFDLLPKKQTKIDENT